MSMAMKAPLRPPPELKRCHMTEHGRRMRKADVVSPAVHEKGGLRIAEKAANTTSELAQSDLTRNIVLRPTAELKHFLDPVKTKTNTMSTTRAPEIQMHVT